MIVLSGVHVVAIIGRLSKGQREPERSGIVLSIEVSRLARNSADWYQLLDLCSLTDTLIADADGLHHPGYHNDRLLLGLRTCFKTSVTASSLPTAADRADGPGGST